MATRVYIEQFDGDRYDIVSSGIRLPIRGTRVTALRAGRQVAMLLGTVFSDVELDETPRKKAGPSVATTPRAARPVARRPAARRPAGSSFWRHVFGD